MSAIAAKPHVAPALFQWRRRDGSFILVSEMDTGHLWNTFRMIWNHSMPKEARTLKYNQYTFGPFYTVEYIRAALKAMAVELATREIPYWAKRDFAHMMFYFRDKTSLLYIEEFNNAN